MMAKNQNFQYPAKPIKRQATKNQKEPISKTLLPKLTVEKPRCPTIQYLTLIQLSRKNQRDPNPVEKILKPTPFSKEKESSRTGYFFTLHSKANPEKPQE